MGSPHAIVSLAGRGLLLGPGKVLAYVRGQGSASAGHNPLGGWSVLVLLLLLLGQAMLEGSAPGRQGQAAPAALWPALVAVLMVALALWWGLQQAPKPAILAW